MSGADVDGTADAAEVNDNINVDEHSPESAEALYCRRDGANPSIYCPDRFHFFSLICMVNTTIEIVSRLSETAYGCGFI